MNTRLSRASLVRVVIAVGCMGYSGCRTDETDLDPCESEACLAPTDLDTITDTGADTDTDSDTDTDTESDAFKIIGYFPTWRDFETELNRLDFRMLTHLNIAFGNPAQSGSIEEDLSDAQIENLVNRAHQAGVRVLISLGGASAPSYQAWLGDAQRASFVDGIIEYVRSHQLDGVDVDLEGGNIPNNYDAFVADLCEALQPEGRLVTAALAPWYADEIPNSSLVRFDWINIMAYDATGPWDLSNPGPHSPYDLAEEDLAFYKNRGVPGERLTVGVPFYGYDFANGAAYVAYSDIVRQHAGAELLDQVGETYYNGIPTLRDKTDLAKAEASGIMIWEVTMDVDSTDDRSLLAAVNEQAGRN